jgi:nitrogen fixation-related uncharacterized protein
VANVLYDLGIAIAGGAVGGLVSYWASKHGTHRAEQEERGQR